MNSGQLLFQNVNLNLLTEILLPVANGLLNFGKFNFFSVLSTIDSEKCLAC